MVVRSEGFVVALAMNTKQLGVTCAELKHCLFVPQMVGLLLQLTSQCTFCLCRALEQRLRVLT
jgi:hypothetical protein